MTTMNMADYIVLLDDSITLDEHEEKTFTFELPTHFYDGASPILAYIANPTSNNNLEYEIDVNDFTIKYGTFSSDVSRVLWQVFESRHLVATGENTIQFRVENGNGPVSFSHIVLWFQRSITF